MSTFHLLEDDLIKEYRRRGQFDTQRKLLLEEFQKSDYHEQFTKEIKNALENEMVLAKGQLPPYKSLMAAIEKKLFPQLMDFLSSREFLKSDTVASRIRAGMKETAMKMSEEKAAEKEQRDSAEQDKTGDKNDVSELPTIAPNSSEPARRLSTSTEYSDMEISEDEARGVGKPTKTGPPSKPLTPSRTNHSESSHPIEVKTADALETLNGGSSPSKIPSEKPTETESVLKAKVTEMDVDLDAPGQIETLPDGPEYPKPSSSAIEGMDIEPKPTNAIEAIVTEKTSQLAKEKSQEAPKRQSRKREKEDTPPDDDADASLSKRRARRGGRISSGVNSVEQPGSPVVEKETAGDVAVGDIVAAFVKVDDALRCYQVKVKDIKEENADKVCIVEDLEPDESESVHTSWNVASSLVFHFRNKTKKMKPGDRCFALYRETPGDPLSTEFYLAVILKVNRNGSVHLRYSDGDEAFTVKTEEILMIDAARADLFDKVEQSQQDEEDGEQVTTKKQPSSSRKGRRGRAKDSRKSSKATTPEAIESKMEPVRPKKVESRAERLSRRRTSVDLTSENREDKVLENSTRRPGSIDVTAKSPALSERSSRRRGSVDVKAESHLERVTRSRGSDVKAMVAVHVEAATPMDVRSDYGEVERDPLRAFDKLLGGDSDLTDIGELTDSSDD